MAPEANIWWRNRWYGPSYPDAGDPPGWPPSPDDDEVGMPDLDELDPDDPARAAGSDGPEPPPRSGPGSGKAAWAAYAAAQGVKLDSDTDRADIIAALDDAGIRTE